MPDFIHNIVTYQKLASCVCLQSILAELDSALSLKSCGHLLSYDTTFNTGDCYVSPLLFKHVAFNENPVMMAGVFSHERKFEVHHNKVFSIVQSMVETKNTTNVPIAINEEEALMNANEKETNLYRVGCSRHL